MLIKTRTLYLLFAVLWVVGIISCSNNSGQNRLNPKEIISDQGINIPVYDREILEELLNYSNDTTYVINFWATWCRPCVAELPYFEHITEKYNDQPVKVILISQDMKSAVKSALIPFIKKRALQSDVILLHDPDANAWINKVDTNWSGALPATVIYNSSYRYFREGNFEKEELIQFVEKALDSK